MNPDDVGIAMREDRTRIDFAELRRARRERVLAAMEEQGIDVCLLGREANGRYASGSRRLWTSNTRPFLPSTIVVRETGRVHVMTLSGSIEDAAEDVERDDVFGRSFDPETMLRIFAAVPGLGSARRVGVDGFSPAARALVARVCPRAAVVAAEPMMREIRAVKLPGEVDCLRVAIAIAESALQAAADRLRPGTTAGELRALYLERMARLGTSTFAQQGTFAVARPAAEPPFVDDGRPFREGEPVVLAGGALWAGYEGSLARTRWCGDAAPPREARDRHERALRLRDALVDRCRPGTTGRDLARAYDTVGAPMPRLVIAYGLGLGHEGPLAGSATGATLDQSRRLASGMVLGLRSWISDGAAGHLVEEMVRITDESPEILTRMAHGFWRE